MDTGNLKVWLLEAKTKPEEKLEDKIEGISQNIKENTCFEIKPEILRDSSRKTNSKHSRE